MGLFVGFRTANFFTNLRLVLMALIVGCMIGVASGLLLWAARKLTGRDLLVDPYVEAGEIAPQSGLAGMTFPFGPSLAIVSAIAVLFPQTLVG